MPNRQQCNVPHDIKTWLTLVYVGTRWRKIAVPISLQIVAMWVALIAIIFKLSQTEGENCSLEPLNWKSLKICELNGNMRPEPPSSPLRPRPFPESRHITVSLQVFSAQGYTKYPLSACGSCVTGSEKNLFFQHNSSCYLTFRRNNLETQACTHSVFSIHSTNNRKAHMVKQVILFQWGARDTTGTWKQPPLTSLYFHIQCIQTEKI